MSVIFEPDPECHRHETTAQSRGRYIVKRGKTTVKLNDLLTEGDKVIPMLKKRAPKRERAAANA